MGIIPGILTFVGANKYVAYMIEFLVAVSIVAGAAFYIAHLYSKANAYDVLRAEDRALEIKYGCDKRGPAERDLPACLIARDLDAAKAQAAEIARQRDNAAKHQAMLDKADADAAKSTAADDAFIDQDAQGGDGDVPKVLLDSWARERATRGVK